jgi:hypothetical protein
VTPQMTLHLEAIRASATARRRDQDAFFEAERESGYVTSDDEGDAQEHQQSGFPRDSGRGTNGQERDSAPRGRQHRRRRCGVL